MVERFIPEGYVDLVESARILKIHPVTLRRLVHQQRVPGVIKVFGKYLIRKTELDQFAANYEPGQGRQNKKPWRWIERALPAQRR